MGPVNRDTVAEQGWFSWTGFGLIESVDSTAMDISYDLNRIQGVVLPAYLCVGGKMPYFTRIACAQYEVIFGLVPSNFELQVLTPVFFYPSRKQDVVDFRKFRISPTSSILLSYRFARLFPTEENEPRRSRRRDQDGFRYSDFSAYLFKDYEARLAERIPDISYTGSYAPPEVAHPDHLGLTTYSALPPDNDTRMPWSPTSFFRARTSRKESRESRPSPLSPS
ncbi:hypothetical protein PIB30_070594 [Stylosanthes scabra]|uniref:Uncharacterized protein n=1 Tax=Stylosanthes scabra TaxID=79078 RepID=A0ABU6ZM63_9FABA|nr:hypothetical protein [Stylosanthes scabra]